jgi:Rrf2 family iron-sulfur cluster assembly transcriptional regulator
MQMTTKGRLAVVAMIDVAARSADGPVALCTIAARRNISMSYLEQLFGKLRREGLVRSVRGPGGGYVLALPAETISVADIVRAVDDAAVVQEADPQPAFDGDRDRCDTSGLWRDVKARMIELMGAITLGSLVAQEPVSAPTTSARPARRGISSEPVVKPFRTNAPNSVFALGVTLDERLGGSAPVQPGVRAARHHR